MNKRKIIASVFSCISILGWIWIPAFAETTENQTAVDSESSSILIGEIAWAGSSRSSADEWLELWNLSTADTNIGGFRLTGASSEPILFPATATIPGLGVYLISNYAQQEERSVIATTSHLVTTALSLSNSALQITLQNASGTIIDSVGNGQVPSAGSSGKTPSSMFHDIHNTTTSTWISASQTKNMKDNVPDLGTPGWCDACTAQIHATSSTISVEISSTVPTIIEDQESLPILDIRTPTSSIDIPPKPNYHLVRLNEIEPAPSIGKEWIEIISLDKEKVIPLAGYTIHDAKGRIIQLTEGTIAPQQHLILQLSRAVLANSGDTVSLYAPTEKLIDTMRYTTTKKGEAWARLPDGTGEWSLATYTSPSAVNLFHEPLLTAFHTSSTSQENRDIVTSTIEQLMEQENPEEEEIGIEPEKIISEIHYFSAPTSTSTKKEKAVKAMKKTKISLEKRIRSITFNTLSTLDMDEPIRVRLYGIVGTPIGLIKARSFILQAQDGRGILVTATTDRKLPTLGKEIVLTGRLTANDAGITLKLHADDSWQQHTSTTHATSSTPRAVDLFIPSSQDIWNLVQTTGTVQEIKGRKVLIDVDGATVEINISNKIAYRPQRLKKGDVLRIQGILAPSTDMPRIFPRSADDIEIIHRALVTEPMQEKIQEHLPLGSWTPVGATAGAIGIAESAKHLHRKRKEKKLMQKIKTTT